MEDLFLHVTPERAGIPSKAVIRFLKQLEENEVDIHSFCMMRGDKIFAEGYWKPFCRDYQHRMYSAGKSFVSIAIGILQAEGKLKITDRICDYFPDKLPQKGVHPYIAETTIRDMLMMATPHHSTTYKRYDSDDWVESFFAVEPSHYPGTVFSYDTSSSHVLSALVERLSGKSLMEFLKSRLSVLNLSAKAKFLPDPMGVSQGGSGLVCTMEDLYKTAYVCMNHGRFQNLQLIPEQYLKEAVSKQIDTGNQAVIDERQGYGYQFWKSRYGGFAMYGMGGQLAVCLPDEHLLFATAAYTLSDPTGVQGLYEAFWQNIFPFARQNEAPLAENKADCQALSDMLGKLSVKPMIRGSRRSELSGFVGGKKYRLEKNPMGLEYFILRFDREPCLLEYKNEKGIYKIPFKPGEITPFSLSESLPPMISSAAWESERIFGLQVNMTREIFGNVKAQIGFNRNYATVALKKAAEILLDKYSGFASGKIADTQ